MLIVILGAGASFDCTSKSLVSDINFEPPQMKDLFSDRRSFVKLQVKYPRLNAASTEIRARTSADSVSIENFIRDTYLDTEVLEDKRAYYEIPLYLQELLYEVSKNYTRTPEHYQLLVSVINRSGIAKVAYVTLNYDLLLDQVLEETLGFAVNSIDSYISDNKKWCLYKLHGSVNWGYKISPSPQDANEKDGFIGALRNIDVSKVDRSTTHLRHGDLNSYRFASSPSCLFYPALSVPVGSQDELTCPKEHTENLSAQIKSEDRIDLLVIGYSGNDKEVINTLSSIDRAKVKSVKVVNRNIKHARTVASKICQPLSMTQLSGMTTASEFGNFVRDDTGLRSYLRGITGKSGL